MRHALLIELYQSHKIVIPDSKGADYDADGADSMDTKEESVKQSRGA
jgi:hypothetical protein